MKNDKMPAFKKGNEKQYSFNKDIHVHVRLEATSAVLPLLSHCIAEISTSVH